MSETNVVSTDRTPAPLPPHVQRMITEHAELDARLTKLNAYVEQRRQLNSTATPWNELTDFALLEEQQYYMRYYLRVLAQRLARAGVSGHG